MTVQHSKTSLWLSATDREVKQWCQNYHQHVTNIFKDDNHIILHRVATSLCCKTGMIFCWLKMMTPILWMNFRRMSYCQTTKSLKQTLPLLHLMSSMTLNSKYEDCLPWCVGDKEDASSLLVLLRRIMWQDGHSGIGTTHDNPLMNTHHESVSANLITQHIFSQEVDCGEGGHQYLLLDKITDIRPDPDYQGGYPHWDA